MTNRKFPHFGNYPHHPPWLFSFLFAHYFSRCIHGHERNHYCIDCLVGPLCPIGVKEHSDHHTLQVRKASYFDAIRITDIRKLVDISDIQTYIINNARIVFLLERPHCNDQHKKEPKDWTKVCLSCQRTLTDSLSYCSIGCKFLNMKKSLDDLPLSLNGAVHKSSTEVVPMDQSISYESRKEIVTLAYNCCDLISEEEGENCYPSISKKRRGNAQEGPPAPETPPRKQYVSASLRREGHMRKGTPHRAPFL